MTSGELFASAPERGALPPEPTEDRLYSYEDVARSCMVSVQTVWEWVARGKVESPRYLGVTARFSRAQMVSMGERIHPEGTFPVTPSPRALAARKVVGQKRAAAAAAAAAEKAAAEERERVERLAAEERMMEVAKPKTAAKPKTVAKPKTAARSKTAAKPKTAARSKTAAKRK